MVIYILYEKVAEFGKRRRNYGTEQEACDGNEGYFA